MRTAFLYCLSIAIFIATVGLALLLAACSESPTDVELGADTIYVYIDRETRHGVKTYFADGLLENRIENYEKAGWECQYENLFINELREIGDDNLMVVTHEFWACDHFTETVTDSRRSP